MTKRIAFGGGVLLALCTLVVPASPASAAEPAVTDPEQVGRFVDELLSRQLEEHGVPGAAVSVVAGGRQVFAKGYGLADVEADQPVVADRTVFPIDSTSKLLTGTAVLQLVERGELDLDTDVNQYLKDFQLPDTFPGKPITVRHLLTHTAGFEERNIGMYGDPGDSLGDYLGENIHERVRPPGGLPAYSNYGVALAGHLVELRSGLSFERFVERNILRPLGMRDTTFAQPRPPEIASQLTRLHNSNGKAYPPAEHDYQAPAGAAVATVTDIGRFMLAQLDGGRLDGTRILSPAGVQDMQRAHSAVDERLSSMGWTFQRRTYGAEPVLQHGGDGTGSHGELTLFPEQDVGVYVVYNGEGDADASGVTGGARAAVQEFGEAFAEHFFPAARATGTAKAAPDPDLERYAGGYLYTRRSASDITTLFADLLAGVTVTANPDGTLTIEGMVTIDPERTTVRWKPLGAGLFQATDGPERIAFTDDVAGTQGMALAAGYDPTTAWQRVAWHEMPVPRLIFTGACVLVLLSTLSWPIGTVVRRLRALAGAALRADRVPDNRVARWLAAAATLSVLGFLATSSYLVLDIDRLYDAMAGGSALLTAVLLLPLLTAALAVGMLACTVLAWRQRWWSRLGRVHYTTLTLATVGFLGVAHAYHYLTWPLG